jgi:hypothetical protein
MKEHDQNRRTAINYQQFSEESVTSKDKLNWSTFKQIWNTLDGGSLANKIISAPALSPVTLHLAHWKPKNCRNQSVSKNKNTENHQVAAKSWTDDCLWHISQLNRLTQKKVSVKYTGCDLLNRTKWYISQWIIKTKYWEPADYVPLLSATERRRSLDPYLSQP